MKPNDFGELLLKYITLPIKFLLAILVIAGGFLFLPSNLAQSIGIEEFRNNYRSYIGILFWVSFCLTVIPYLIWPLMVSGWKIIQKKALTQKRQKEIIDLMPNLTSGQKAILRRFINGNTQTQSFLWYGGDVIRLKELGIIHQKTGPDSGGSCVYNIDVFVWDYLNKNHGILE